MTAEIGYAIGLGVAIAALGFAFPKRPIALTYWAIACGWYPLLAASIGARSSAWVALSVSFGVAFGVLGLQVYRRLPRRPIWDSSGPFGFVILAGAPWLAMALGWIGWIVAGAAYLALVIASDARFERALRRIRRKLADPMPWVEAAHDEESMSTTCTMGHWKTLRVLLSVDEDAIKIRTGSQRWPAGLILEPRNGSLSDTGDGRFDAVISIGGDESAWRPALSTKVRALLIELFTTTEPRLARQDLTVLVHEPHAVEAALDLLVRLDEALPDVTDEPEQRVFENVATESDGGLRLRGYRWLVARGWRVQDVQRAASVDPDPKVVAWAREQLPVADGMFR